MASGKSKAFTRLPTKKNPTKGTSLRTADDFQDAADFEEAAGGKHRVGDPLKSSRAFKRALECYDKGIEMHPKDFDLAYNKARLQFELSQQPVLMGHLGVEPMVLLNIALQSHRQALKLNEENPDVLFNTAQVLSSLAEQLTGMDREADAVPLLQEALELLSSCLSRQEFMYEQHQLDFPDTEDGGVALDDNQPTQPSSSEHDGSMEDNEQSATVETPVGPNDLLDTVHASLAALTTLVPFVDEQDLANLGEMARQLTESKAPEYIRLLPADDQEKARFPVVVDRAIFVSAYANAQFEHHMIELQTYVERLEESFSVPNKSSNVDALVSEGEARVELVLTTLDRFIESSDSVPATLSWKQLSTAQDLYTQASKLNNTDEAKKSKAEIYLSKGDVELLRLRVTQIPKSDLADTTRNSAPTLIQNAQTYYKGAVAHAKAQGEEEVESEAQQKWNVARAIAGTMYGGPALDLKSTDVEALMEGLEECVERGLVDEKMAEAIVHGGGQGAGSSSSR